MSTISWSNGIGEQSGDSLLTATGLTASGNVIWVSSLTGNNANHGSDRRRPVATLAQAITNADNDSIIVLMDGHTEAIGSQLTIGTRLTIAGAGTNAGAPTVSFSRTFNGIMFNVTEPVQFRNIKYTGSTVASTSPAISLTSTATGAALLGCQLSQGENDNGPALNIACDHVLVENCRFTSTATVDPAYPAVEWITTTRAGLWFRNCVFDGGARGFVASGVSGPAVKGYTVECKGLRMEGITLLNGADIWVYANGGWVQVGSAAGGGSVTI